MSLVADGSNTSEAHKGPHAILHPITSLQHLNVGVPTRKQKSSRKHKGKLDQDVTESDVFYAAKCAASFAQSLQAARELNWNENRTSQLQTSMLYLMEPQARSVYAQSKSLSPTTSFHHLPTAVKQQEIQSLQMDQNKNRLERERRREKARLRKQHDQGFLDDSGSAHDRQRDVKLDKLREGSNRVLPSEKTEATSPFTANTTVNTNRSFESDVISSLPSNATPCSACQPQSPCRLLTSSHHAIYAQVQPKVLSSLNFRIRLRSYANQPLCVRVESNAPQLLFVTPSPVLYIWPQSEQQLIISYVGDFSKECAALSSDAVNSRQSVHFLTVSARVMSETDVVNGCALSHPSRFWEFANSYQTHSTIIHVVHQKGTGNQTNSTKLDARTYQFLDIASDSKESTDHLVDSGFTSVKFDVPADANQAKQTASKRSRSMRARTMVNLAAMRADIASELSVALPAPAKNSIEASNSTTSNEPADAKTERLLQRLTLTRAISRRSSGDPLSPLPVSLLSSSLLNEASSKFAQNTVATATADAQANSEIFRTASSNKIHISRIGGSRADLSTQTDVSYLQGIQSMPLEEWEETADYEVDDHTSSQAQIAVDPHFDRLRELLSEWSQLLQSAEYRRLEEKSRLTSLREHQLSEEDSGISYQTVNPISGQFQLSQRRYLDRELAAIDFERETLMLIEIEISKQIPIMRAANAAAASTSTFHSLENEFVTSRDRAIRVESIRSNHRMQLLQAIRRTDSPRRPHSVRYAHTAPSQELSTQTQPQHQDEADASHLSHNIESGHIPETNLSPTRGNSNSPSRVVGASVAGRSQLSPGKPQKLASSSLSPSFLRTQSVYSAARQSSLSTQKILLRDRDRDFDRFNSSHAQQQQQQRHISRAASATPLRSTSGNPSPQRTNSAQPRVRHRAFAKPPVESTKQVNNDHDDQVQQPLSEEDDAENAVYEAASEEAEESPPLAVISNNAQDQYEFDEFDSQMEPGNDQSHFLELANTSHAHEQRLPNYQPIQKEENDTADDVNEDIEYEYEDDFH